MPGNVTQQDPIGPFWNRPLPCILCWSTQIILSDARFLSRFTNAKLEKTLESSLDCKEIKQVNPKGNQSWIFIGRTDAETETPILWPPDAKNWLIGKGCDAGKDWRQEKKGMTEDEMVGWHQWLNGREFDQLWETVEDREACYAADHVVAKSQMQLSDWTTTPVLEQWGWVSGGGDPNPTFCSLSASSSVSAFHLQGTRAPLPEPLGF